MIKRVVTREEKNQGVLTAHKWAKEKWRVIKRTRERYPDKKSRRVQKCLKRVRSKEKEKKKIPI